MRNPTPLWVRTVVVMAGTALAAAVIVPMALQWAGGSPVDGVALEPAGVSASGGHSAVLRALGHPLALAISALVTGVGLGWAGRRRLRAIPTPLPAASATMLPECARSAEDPAAVARRFVAEVEPVLDSLRRLPVTRERDPLGDDSLQLTLAV